MTIIGKGAARILGIDLDKTPEQTIPLDSQVRCQHDFDKPIRKGRAWYACPKCGKDISLEYVFWIEAVQRIELMGGVVSPNT